MKSKKVFVLVSALALLLGACHNGGNKDTSSANTATSAPDTQVTTSEPSQSSQSGEIAVTALALNKATLSLEAGKSETLSVTVTPDNASNTKVTWDSDNKEVATVSSLGKVSALKVGTAKITVKSQSNPNVNTVLLTNQKQLQKFLLSQLKNARTTKTKQQMLFMSKVSLPKLQHMLLIKVIPQTST